MAPNIGSRAQHLRSKLLIVLFLATLALVGCSGGEDDQAIATSADGGDVEAASEDDADSQDDAAADEIEEVEDSEQAPVAIPFDSDLNEELEALADRADRVTTTTGAPGTSTSTSTTAGSTGSSGSGGSSSGGSAPASSGAGPVNITAPSCGALGAASTRTAPYTGLQASIPAGLPAVAVKVSNNSSTARANLIGLDQADIVIEQRIESSATRFFSIFHSSLPANVGPVRSGRTTDIDLAANLGTPVFAYSGANRDVDALFENASSTGRMVVFRNNDSSPFARDSRYSSPDNLFVSPAGLGACGSGNARPIFNYGANNSGTAEAASAVSFSARSSFRFDWNGSAWVRSQSGSAHVTRQGAALDPANVVVLFTPTVVQGEMVIQPTISSGEAWVLRDGTITRGTYARDTSTSPYTLRDGNGTAINLAPGQTWVVLAPAGTANVG